MDTHQSSKLKQTGSIPATRSMGGYRGWALRCLENRWTFNEVGVRFYHPPANFNASETWKSERSYKPFSARLAFLRGFDPLRWYQFYFRLSYNGKYNRLLPCEQEFDSSRPDQVFMPRYANWQCGFSQKELAVCSNQTRGTSLGIDGSFESHSTQHSDSAM